MGASNRDVMRIIADRIRADIRANESYVDKRMARVAQVALISMAKNVATVLRAAGVDPAEIDRIDYSDATVAKPEGH
jgi:type IV pilus biogenesis protein CpaD/CtpE